MQLGLFSTSLTVKDLARSQTFYEKLGFERTGGGDKYAILVNGTTVVGLFEGMFEKNILTFNPGFGSDLKNLESFTDVRDLKKQLEAAGIPIIEDTTGDKPSGPAHLTLMDPDGNPILIDQHV